LAAAAAAAADVGCHIIALYQRSLTATLLVCNTHHFITIFTNRSLRLSPRDRH